MAEKKKAAKKKHVHGDGTYEKRAADKPSAKEKKEALARFEAITSGKKDGIVVVLETFKQGDDTGIHGMTYAHGMGPVDRVRALIAASGVPEHMVMAILAMTSGFEEPEAKS